MTQQVLDTDKFNRIKNTIASASAVIKVFCGVANNCSYIVMGNAYDAIKKHPHYKHSVKKAFRLAIEEWKIYERGLLYAKVNRMFHVVDMPAEARKKYGDMTGQEYFEYWQGLGGAAYTRTKDLLDSLYYKYQKSLKAHSVPHDEIIAHLLLCDACFMLAEKIHTKIMEEVKEQTGLPMSFFHEIYDQFSISRVIKAWEKALLLVDPKTFDYDIGPTEARNIELGLIQLEDRWGDLDFIFESVKGASLDFAEVFRTEGELKKALREVQKVKVELIEDRKELIKRILPQ